MGLEGGRVLQDIKFCIFSLPYIVTLGSMTIVHVATVPRDLLLLQHQEWTKSIFAVDSSYQEWLAAWNTKDA